MTPRQRVLAAVNGDRPDRTPFSVWRHFHRRPPAGPHSDMCSAEIAFYHRFEPDILKVMHDIPFEPLPPMTKSFHWSSMPVLNPVTGNFGDQLYTLSEIRSSLGPDVPMLETVFGVYHYAEELSHGKLLEHLAEDPNRVHAGLEALAESLARYAAAAIKTGCDGIYYALSGANSVDGPSNDEYRRSFLPYDRMVLDAAKGAPLNTLHIHGNRDTYFDLAEDLPAAIICWSDRTAGPSIAEARRTHRGVLMGGLDETKFAGLTVAQIDAQVRDAILQNGPTGLIVAPGCAIPESTNPALIDAIRTAVEF